MLRGAEVAIPENSQLRFHPICEFHFCADEKKDAVAQREDNLLPSMNSVFVT